ncbi:MAG TPA: hypothetical protein VLR94_04525 [Acidobacteriota bacterium]|nr:hypothetical protein [Acidobacteriota bacterium]
MRVMSQLLLVFFVIFTSLVFAQQPARLTDDQVKKLVDEAMKTSDKFRDAFKKVASVTTRTGVKVDVPQYMKDYDETFKKFKDAFDKNGVPSVDLVNLLRMTNELDGFMTRNPDAAGAGSEWQAHKFNMDRLAQAFHTQLGEDSAPPKRMSDDQVKGLMEGLKEGSKSLGKSVQDAMKKDKSFDKSTTDATMQSLKSLQKSAETLSDLYNDKKPFSVEMQGFIKQMDVIKSFLTDHPLSTAIQSQFEKLEGKSKQLTDEYGIAS